jgi:transcriptional regulator of acetoin/glycerol metabolism
MATGPKITLRDLPAPVRQAAGVALPRGITPTSAFGERTNPLDLRETERKLMLQALAATNGNVTAAARRLGISRRTLHRKINEMNAEKESEDSPAAAPAKTREDAR